MSRTILYVYAIGNGMSLDDLSYLEESIDGTELFGVISAAGLDAVCTAVDAVEFSQEQIDRRSSDLEWLGTIGYRHETVVAQLSTRFAVIPLRAFTLFSAPDALRSYLSTDAERLQEIISRIGGRDEWTVRVEFDAEIWQSSLSRRVPSLQHLEEEIAGSPEGRAYLLNKKLEEERRRAARQAENDLVMELEQALTDALRVPSITESKQKKGGSFPEVNLLIPRERSGELRSLFEKLRERYAPEGVVLVLTGPWPPYTFASGDTHAG